MDKYIIVAKDMPQSAKDSLINLGYSLIDSACLSTVHPSLKYHPDMQIVKGDNCYICAPCCYDYYKPYFKKIGIKLIKGNDNPKEKYPFDVLYNVAIVGNNAIHNFKYTDKSFFENSNYNLIDVKQGYSKCSLCVICDNAVITSDEGIKNQLENYNIDVLLVNKGDVMLEPFEYGFIGGASGIVDGKIAFCGNIRLHKDYHKIKSFCDVHNVEILNLSDSKPVDVGTIIMLG
jgi:hypothetical protein